MGEIAVPENLGSVSGNDLLCTLFHKEFSGTKDEVPLSAVTDSNVFAGASSVGPAGNDYPINNVNGRASDAIFGYSPATTSDDQEHLDNSDASRSASDWSAAIDTSAPEVSPSSYSQPDASSSQMTPVDQSILEPIPILVPPMGKSRGT